MKHIIDCDADPTTEPMERFLLFKHQKDGMLEWDPDDLELYPIERPDGYFEKWYGVRTKHDKKELNANVLDYLLEHPELIPDEWGGKEIFFCGTAWIAAEDAENKNYDGTLMFRFLYGSKGCWSNYILCFTAIYDPIALR